MIKTFILLILLSTVIHDGKINKLIQQNSNHKKYKITDISPDYLKVYHSINKYSKEYNIPIKYAYRMLKEETNWRGPKYNNWNPYQISYANALGPTQLLMKTARWMANDYSISKHKVLNDIEFNIRISMKFIRWIHDTQISKWNYVFGYYNTGYIKCNDYSKRITS